MESISIRRAGEADAPAFAELTNTLGYNAETTVMTSRLRAILRSDTDLLIVAVDSRDTVVGWLQAHAAHIVESGFRIEITGLIVSPAQRRRGAGRALVAEAILVRSNIQREESHAFYPALGYTATKTQHVYRKPLPPMS